MTVRWRVVERCNDGSFFLQAARDYLSAILCPLSAFIFQTVGIYPSSDDVFILCCSCGSRCSCKQVVREYHDVLAVSFSCVVILPSRQCIGPSIFLSLQMVNLDVVVSEL